MKSTIYHGIFYRIIPYHRIMHLQFKWRGIALGSAMTALAITVPVPITTTVTAFAITGFAAIGAVGVERNIIQIILI